MLHRLSLAAWLLALAPAIALGAPQTSVTIETPTDGEVVSGPVVFEGTSTGLMNGRVVISIDGGPFRLAQGTSTWSYVWDSTTVGDGPRSVRARARECFACTPSFDAIDIVVANGGNVGVQEFTYASSVDGTPLDSKLWIPAGHDPNGPPVPLVVHLHGGGGIGQINPAMQAELDARGWIGIAPDGREWGIFGGACTWRFSSAYVNSPDPNVGPGEQDILDAIEWARANHPIDGDRIYLTGFSMGGRGAYIIGLKHPDLFAAIAPMGGPSDMFEVWVRRTNPGDCKEGMTGGPPGTSAFVDTMHHVTSARFLVENAYSLPVHHGHGLFDTVASNTPTESDYLHGWHMTSDTSFAACHAAPAFCFGHTPTLSELAARHPGAYDWAYMFTPVAHVQDNRWLTGTAAAPGLFGTEDPLAPGELVGIYDFFGARSLVHSPDTVVYKTYEDEHLGAYWAEILTSAPWTTLPAALRATRDAANNVLSVEATRAAELSFDVAGAGLALSAAAPLAVVLERLVEPVYDPALDATGAALAPLVRLCAPGIAGATVLLDGAVLDPALVLADGDAVSVGPIAVTGTHVLDVHVAEVYCAGGTNSAGLVAGIGHGGTASVARNDFVLRTDNGVPSTLGLFFHGFGEASAPLGMGVLCIGGPLYRGFAPIQLDSVGAGEVSVDLAAPPFAAGPGAVQAGAVARFQFWYRDVAGGAAASNTSDALRVTFLP